MLEGKALIEDTDMPMKMQIQAMTVASQALDLYDVVDCKQIAAHIKKVPSLSLSHFCKDWNQETIFLAFPCSLRFLRRLESRNTFYFLNFQVVYAFKVSAKIKIKKKKVTFFS